MYFPLNVSSIFEKISLVEVPALFQKAKKSGVGIVGMNASGTLHDLSTVSDAIIETGIKALVGTTFPFRVGTNNVKLAIYPRTNSGKKLLISLSSTFHKNERKDLTLQQAKEVLRQSNIVIDTEEVENKVVLETIRTLSVSVSKKQVYVGLYETFSQKNKEKNLQLKEIMRKEKVEFVNFNKVLFLEEAEFDAFYDLMKIRGEKLPEDVENIFLKQEEVKEIYNYMAPFEESTSKFAKSSEVDWKIEKGEMKIPSFAVPKEFEVPLKFQQRYEDFIKESTAQTVRSAAYLFKMVFTGVLEKYGQDKVAIERAFKELDVIIKKDFSDYFLIVADFINYGKQNGIILGPGRGSVCGSLAAYCLNITEVEPLRYNLQFERFLTIHRTDFPDIDIDVSQKTRERLISYVRSKYGNDYVSQIITRSNWGFKNTIRDYLKLYRVSNEKINTLMSLTPENFASYGEFMGGANEETKNFVEGSKDIRDALQTVYLLKSLPQGTSKHAAGVVLSSTRLEDIIPMMYEEGRLMTQITNDNKSLENMGFLKFDILGIRNLDIISDAEILIKNRKKVTLPKELPLDDEKTLNLFKEGNLLGIFQMESAGMSRSAKEIGVSSFEEIVSLSALYRPGPMGNIPLFAKQKGKPIKMESNGVVLKDVECLYPILKETNGIIVFQEQINQIAVEWAGYDLISAELFRSAVSKKREELLQAEESTFIEKAVQIGRDKDTSKKIFDLILKFAQYGFPKGHAVAYSMISYRTAFLKANYPTEYMSALMTSVGGNTKKVAPYIEETRKLSIAVLRPDVNESTTTFVPTDSGVRSALQMINGVGLKTVEALVEIRGKIPFKNFSDFVNRVKNSPVDKGTIETMIKVGALDSLGERHDMLVELGVLEKGKAKPFTNGEKIIEEMKFTETVFSIDANLMKRISEKCADKENCVAGVLKSVSEIKDKYQKDMARVQIIGFDGTTNYLVVFNQLWKKEKNKFVEGSVVMAQIDNRAIKKIATIKI